VSEKVDVIVTGGSAATRAAKAATATIPIVFASAADPVGQKLVTTLARPGANVTGCALDVQELGSKRLQLLKELLPRISHVTRIYQVASIDPLQPAIINEDDSGARRLGVALQHVAITDMDSIKAALAAAAQRRDDAIILTGAGLFVGNRENIAKLALRHRLPTMCTDLRFTKAGALVSYGENLDLRYRRVAGIVDKILRGANPANIRVEESTDTELAINMITAKALGIVVSDAFRLQAKHIIE
jgi:putative ABC transport system substrate-binding protein